MAEQGEEARLRAELAEARHELDVMAGSLRFQLGDAIVTGFSGRSSAAGRLRILLSALRRARTLRAVGRIKSHLFSGLPGYGLPADPVEVPPAELAALQRHVGRLARAGAERAGAGWKPAHPWASAALDLAHEFRRAIDAGYPLPAAGPARQRRGGEPGRVLYVTQHDPTTASNGYARRTREITRGLAGLGFDVLAVVPKPRAPDACKQAFSDGEVAYRHLPLGEPAGLAGYVDALAGRIAEAATVHRAGIIHAASNYLNGLAAIAAARSLGLPCVYEVRGLWEETRLTVDPAFAHTLGYAFQSRMEVCCADEADAVVAGSDGIAAELARRGARARFVVAESGAPAQLDIDAAAVGTFRSAFAPGSRILGFVGSLTAYEGFATIAAALARLAAGDGRYRMLVVGDGRHGAEARALFARHGVADKVVFAGKLPLEEAQAAYGAIDLALYPRDRTRVTDIVESLKPVEALAAGVPVLVSDVLPMQGLASDCPAVFAARASDAADVAAKVRQFFERTEAERAALGEAGRAWVAEHRSWEHTARRVGRVYADLS